MKPRIKGGVLGEWAGLAGGGGENLLGNFGGAAPITRGPPEWGAVDQLGVAMDELGEGGAGAGFCLATNERGVGELNNTGNETEHITGSACREIQERACAR